MLNILRHLREVPMKCVDCVEWVDNVEYIETLQRSASETFKLYRVGRQY